VRGLAAAENTTSVPAIPDPPGGRFHDEDSTLARHFHHARVRIAFEVEL
jgi:hypothetical protein